jgi:hypothetical protein
MHLVVEKVHISLEEHQLFNMGPSTHNKVSCLSITELVHHFEHGANCVSDRRNHCATILVKYVAIEHSFISAFCSDVKFDTNVKKLSNCHKRNLDLDFILWPLPCSFEQSFTFWTGSRNLSSVNAKPLFECLQLIQHQI